jgi:hypothetical protein
MLHTKALVVTFTGCVRLCIEKGRDAAKCKPPHSMAPFVDMLQQPTIPHQPKTEQRLYHTCIITKKYIKKITNPIGVCNIVIVTALWIGVINCKCNSFTARLQLLHRKRTNCYQRAGYASNVTKLIYRVTLNIHNVTKPSGIMSLYKCKQTLYWSLVSQGIFCM